MQYIYFNLAIYAFYADLTYSPQTRASYYLCIGDREIASYNRMTDYSQAYKKILKSNFEPEF